MLPSLFLFALPRISPHFWCSAFSLFISMVKTKATTKSQKGKQKRIEFVREVAAEVSALQAAERRRAADDSPVRGSRLHFLRALVADLEKRFSEGEWVQAEGVEEWVEASSCSCERVFSYVTACDRGQTTERMCETLWVRCNGVEVEDWCPTEVFDELRLTQFRPRILKQPSKSQVQVDDGSLLLFEAYKDLEVQSVLPMDLDLDEEIRRLWAVPRRASKGKTACTASVPEI